MSHDSIKQTNQSQNTQVSTSTLINNNYGNQNIATLSKYPSYKDIRDDNDGKEQYSSRGNPAINTLVSKGMTYEQILELLRKNKNSKDLQNRYEKSKQEEEEQKKRDLVALK